MWKNIKTKPSEIQILRVKSPLHILSPFKKHCSNFKRLRTAGTRHSTQQLSSSTVENIRCLVKDVPEGLRGAPERIDFLWKKMLSIILSIFGEAIKWSYGCMDGGVQKTPHVCGNNATEIYFTRPQT